MLKATAIFCLLSISLTAFAELSTTETRVSYAQSALNKVIVGTEMKLVPGSIDLDKIFLKSGLEILNAEMETFTVKFLLQDKSSKLLAGSIDMQIWIRSNPINDNNTTIRLTDRFTGKNLRIQLYNGNAPLYLNITRDPISPNVTLKDFDLHLEN